jgi:pimeloyl-ACP methyl ester carboxylesterase
MCGKSSGANHYRHPEFQARGRGRDLCNVPVRRLGHDHQWSAVRQAHGYMPADSARAYLRDLPDAELHLLDGGHWLLETHLAEIVALTRDFLDRVHR